MRLDSLSSGTPKRLLHQEGKWSLEVVRQVAVDRSVYRPQSQHLDGPELILGYLRRNPSFHGLADSAMKLLKMKSEQENRSFDAVDGEWIPSAVANEHLDEIQWKRTQAARRTQHVQLTELRTEHIRLQHAYRALLQKVNELSTKVETQGQVLEGLKSGGYVPAVAPLAAPAPQPQREAEPAPVAAPQEVAPAEQERPTIGLPPAKDLIKCLEQLIGGDASASEAPGTFAIGPTTLAYVSMLVTDSEEAMGAIVMDLTATVYLGGTLLMVPEAELAQQVQKKAPSEDSVAASSEVCNSLAGAINNVQEEIHVRSNFLEAIDFAATPWLAKPTHVLTFKDTFGGKLSILAR